MDAQVFFISKSQTSIGRGLENDLVIQNPQVSRKHAEIIYTGMEFVIVDFDSAAGTYVNNVKVKKNKIYSGDIILIADVPLMFLDENDPLYKEMEKRTDKKQK